MSGTNIAYGNVLGNVRYKHSLCSPAAVPTAMPCLVLPWPSTRPRQHDAEVGLRYAEAVAGVIANAVYLNGYA
eukprot:3356891-Rhodomonas_salina.1